MKSFPMQPIVLVKDDKNGPNGVVRFMENRLVSAFVDAASEGRHYDLNKAAIDAAHGKYTDAEQMQLAQLIGYSVSGFGDLSYADKEVVRRADRKASLL